MMQNPAWTCVRLNRPCHAFAAAFLKLMHFKSADTRCKPFLALDRSCLTALTGRTIMSSLFGRQLVSTPPNLYLSRKFPRWSNPDIYATQSGDVCPPVT